MSGITASLSELAARVQRSRTTSAVLETAGQGLLRLGMRLYAFQVSGDELVLRHLATAVSRKEAIEKAIACGLLGLRAPIGAVPLAVEVVRDGHILHREDLDVFDSFMREATGFDPSSLDSAPATAGIRTGVLAPIFVAGRTWGLLGVTSRALKREDADAVALFASHVGCALEVAETINALEVANGELETCHADLARAHAGLVERERLAALGELAAVLAHEVRTPLCVLFQCLGGIGEFLRKSEPSDKLSDAQLYASMAAEEANHLNRIVTDLLDFARPHPPELHPATIYGVLESLASATAPDGRVLVESESGLPATPLDPLFMERALLNLVLRALQGTSKDGKVFVRAAVAASFGSHGTAVRIDVTDDGQGIPADVRARVFQPFLGATQPGPDLGVAVAKRIVEAHGGSLTVATGSKGTTFTVTLPVAT